MEEKGASPPSDPNTAPAAATPNNTDLPSTSSPQECHQHCREDFAVNFTSMYHSIFPPKSPLPGSFCLTPSTCCSTASSDDLHLNFNITSDAIATEHRLNQARLILEYQQLCDQYDLCLVRLRALSLELETLRRENTDLRLANSEMVRFLSLSSQAAMKRSLQSDEVSDFNAKRFERRNNNVERDSLPKSISIRSSGYLKGNQQGPSRIASRQRAVNPFVAGSVQQRVYVPTGDNRDDLEALELQVYNQGMVKTELCNKWQETGTCPYGDHCQFAHGITELRPVIRHPRYKTEVCRMVLAGETCPYGHRCHFRHSLTEQEQMQVSR